MSIFLSLLLCRSIKLTCQSRAKRDPWEIGGLRRSSQSGVRGSEVGDEMVIDPLEANSTRLLPKSIGSRVLTFHKEGALISDKHPTSAVIPVSGASRRLGVHEYISAPNEER